MDDKGRIKKIKRLLPRKIVSWVIGKNERVVTNRITRRKMTVVKLKVRVRGVDFFQKEGLRQTIRARSKKKLVSMFWVVALEISKLSLKIKG